MAWKPYALVVASTLVPGCGGDLEPPVRPAESDLSCDEATRAYYGLERVQMPTGSDRLDLDGDEFLEDGLTVIRAELSEGADELGTTTPDEALGYRMSRGEVAWVLSKVDCSRGRVRVQVLRAGYNATSQSLDIVDPGIAAQGVAPIDGPVVVRGGLASLPLESFFYLDPDVATGWYRATEVAGLLQIDDARMDGLLAFAVPHDTVLEVVRPAVRAAYNAFLALDTGCPTACTTVAGDLGTYWDADDDGTISEEDMENSILSAWFNPDTDILAPDGQCALVYWPGGDGVFDHVALVIEVESTRLAL